MRGIRMPILSLITKKLQPILTSAPASVAFVPMQKSTLALMCISLDLIGQLSVFLMAPVRLDLS